MKRLNDPSDLKLERNSLIHLIGIGGTGMSGLAGCLIQRGYKVAGSDMQTSPALQVLKKKGIKLYIGHAVGNINKHCRLVVKSAAITDANPEIIRAKRLRLPIVKYARMVGLLMREKYGIAVAGCHGKTTTSSLLAYTLSRAGKKPSFIIGGYVTDLKSSAHIDKGDAFVSEACEYDRSFHSLFYKIAIINNIEADHLDYYKNLSNIIKSFRIFAGRTPNDGIIIANGDDKNTGKAISGLKRKIIRFGLSEKCDWRATDIKLEKGKWYFTALYHNKPYGHFSLGIQGIHNIYNALAVLAITHHLKLNKNKVGQALDKFSGVGRRFQYHGTFNGALVIDDYGHHPTEIKATLNAARGLYPDKQICLVFQPHQAHRTRCLLNEFTGVLATADKVILPDIYFARDSEAEKKRVSSKLLSEKINQKGGNAHYITGFPKIIKHLRNHLTKRDVVITMGAGDVWKIAKKLIGSNKEQEGLRR
jgi:UDP-N-acetylmuramate--alanine ligase